MQTFAFHLGVETHMHFPVDKRSPSFEVKEIESKEGDKWSQWQLIVYQDDRSTALRQFFAITPNSCSYSLCKSTSIHQVGANNCQKI